MPKIDYNRGTITLTNGSPIVTGSKTYWIGNVNPNDLLYINTGTVTGWHQITEVPSDTQLILGEAYTGTDVTNGFYYIRRNPDRQLTAELARTQLLILDQQTDLESKFDGIDDDVASAQTAATNAAEYSQQAVQSANAANQHMLQAITASQQSQTQAGLAITARNEAETFATTATQQATIATTKASEAANSATQTEAIKTEFEATKGQPDGIPPLDSNGKIPPEYIPGSFREIYASPTLVDFPLVGDKNKLYLAEDTSKTYMWSDTAQTYVNTDTTLALAGTGTAASAAHSDHHHDGIYEPFRNLEWVGTLDESTTDIDTRYFREGFYTVTNGKTVTIQTTPPQQGKIHKLYRKLIQSGTTRTFQDIAELHTDTDIFIISRTATGTTAGITSVSAWNGYSAVNSFAWQGIHPVFTDSYTAESANPNAMYFIPDNTNASPSFAIKTVNHRYPDGTGNINIETNQGKLVQLSDSGAEYANANNIITNGSFHLALSSASIATNYPTADLNHLAEITQTVDANGDIFSVFQRFTSIDTSTGGLSESFRYGLNNGSGEINFSAWVKIK